MTTKGKGRALRKGKVKMHATETSWLNAIQLRKQKRGIKAKEISSLPIGINTARHGIGRRDVIESVDVRLSEVREKKR